MSGKTHRKSYKWIFFVLAGVMLVASGMTVRNTAVADRAVATGLAIDGGADGMLEVSAEVMTGVGREGGGHKAAVVSAKARTVSGALAEINKTTGMSVMLSHCDLVVLGEGILASGAYGVLDHLVRNAHVSENALLTAAEGRAKDILAAEAAFAETPALYAKRMLVSFGDHAGLTRRTVKDFVIYHKRPQAGNWLTLIQKEPAEGGKVTFSLARTAIFDADGKYVMTATAQQTAGLSYFLGEAKKGGIYLEGDGGEDIELGITDKKRRLKLDPSGTRAEINITLHAEVREVSGGGAFGKNALSAAERARAAEVVAQSVRTVFESARAAGADVFDLYGSFYAKYGKKWKPLAAGYLPRVELVVNVDIRLR